MIVYELPSANIRINRARLTSSAGRVRDRRRAVSSSLSGAFNSKVDLSMPHRAVTHGQERSRYHRYAPLVSELRIRSGSSEKSRRQWATVGIKKRCHSSYSLLRIGIGQKAS